MLTGSRIITCHVTMEHTPPLPSGFNINGYLIQSLKQTDSLCHVYYASDADHVQYLLREFCPQGLAVRDPESGKLRYPENTDIEREVLPLKNDFEAQFRTGSLGEIPALGTLYLAYAIPGGHAAAQPAEHFQSDMNGLMEELFDTVTKSVSVPLDRLTQAERTQIIARLYDQGMFELRGAVQFTVHKLACSQASIYRYIKKVKSQTE